VTGSAGHTMIGATEACHAHAPTATGVRGKGGFWAAGLRASSVSKFSNIPNHTKLANSNKLPSLSPKIFKLGMKLRFNKLNNFVNWPNFKFPLYLMI
jgi:hypothetical protein